MCVFAYSTVQVQLKAQKKTYHIQYLLLLSNQKSQNIVIFQTIICHMYMYSEKNMNKNNASRVLRLCDQFARVELSHGSLIYISQVKNYDLKMLSVLILNYQSIFNQHKALWVSCSNMIPSTCIFKFVALQKQQQTQIIDWRKPIATETDKTRLCTPRLIIGRSLHRSKKKDLNMKNKMFSLVIYAGYDEGSDIA